MNTSVSASLLALRTAMILAWANQPQSYKLFPKLPSSSAHYYMLKKRTKKDVPHNEAHPNGPPRHLSLQRHNAAKPAPRTCRLVCVKWIHNIYDLTIYNVRFSALTPLFIWPESMRRVQRGRNNLSRTRQQKENPLGSPIFNKSRPSCSRWS